MKNSVSEYEITPSRKVDSCGTFKGTPALRKQIRQYTRRIGTTSQALGAFWMWKLSITVWEHILPQTLLPKRGAPDVPENDRKKLEDRIN